MSEPSITIEKGLFSKTVKGTMESDGRKTSITATASVFGKRYEVLSDFIGIMPHHQARRNDDEPPGYVQVNPDTIQIYYADGSLAATEDRKRVKIFDMKGIVAVADEYSLGAAGNFESVLSLIRASSQLQGAMKLFHKIAEEMGDAP